MRNLAQTILAQYANSPRLLTIIEAFNKACDPEALIDQFYESVWNIKTASGWGLDVWGRIVNVSRVVSIPKADAYFGFKEAVTSGEIDLTPFNDARFYSKDGKSLIENYNLTDNAFRKLILCKAAANISDGSIKSINNALMILFGSKDKNIWVDSEVDDDGNKFGFAEGFKPFNEGVFEQPAFDATLDMIMTICYDFKPSSVDLTLLVLAGNFLRPAGIRCNFRYDHDNLL